MDIRIKFGLVTGALSGIWYIFYYELLFTNAPFLSILVWLFLLAGIVLGMRYAKVIKHQNKMTFSQGITAGLIITMLTGLFTGIFNTIYIKLINPEFINTYKDVFKKMMANEQINPEEIEKQLLAIDKTFSTSSLLLSSLFATFVVGLVISVISAVVLRNKDMLSTIHPPEQGK